MQSVSIGDNLHEMSNPVSWENKKKYFNVSSAENFRQSEKAIKYTYVYCQFVSRAVWLILHAFNKFMAAVFKSANIYHLYLHIM